ncbi:MAG: hypothetical protein LBI92_04170 [Azoarcus sp.]|nr:hypothetical protein [Azoarcus sp.]
MLKAKRMRGYVKLVAIAVLLAVIVTPSLYVAQTNGVCLKAGRVLNSEELRRRVLVNYLEYSIQNYISLNRKSDTDGYWLGIASPAKETDIRKLVETSFHNEKSIEENFGLEMLVRGRRDIPSKNFDVNGIVEPFYIMMYDTRNSSDWGGIYVSNDIREMATTGHRAIKLREEDKPSWYERLWGYGNHYFYIPSSMIFRQCCDNRKNRSTSHEEYMKQKHRSYIKTLSSWNFDVKLGEKHQGAAVVSNCGGLLTFESNEWGSSRNIIKHVSWTKGE